jgi:aminoglycoside phosphotransferase (APT) family kinase protein
VASHRHPNYRPLAALPRELRRLSVPAGALAWAERHVEGRVVRTRRLPGASTSAVHRLWLDNGSSMVLRRYVWPFVLDDEPVLPAREVDALVFGAVSGLPVPELVAADLSGAEVGDGVPALLMGFLAGRAVPCPDLGRLAEVAAGIHAVDPADFPHEYFEWFARAEGRPPSNAQQVHLWHRAIEILSGGPPPYRRVFVHRDFHPGNVLWRRGRCSGVVDWANACAGPAGCDLGHCRGNLVRLSGIEAADEFRSAYETATGEVHHPYWELASVFDHGPSPWSQQETADGELRLGRALSELGTGRVRPPAAVGRAPGRPAADRTLSAQVVASLVQEQFPTLDPRQVRLIGSGWDNDVYLLNRTWVFRFPRRAEASTWLDREIDIMSVVSDKLGRLVPRFRWFGAPSDRFPYPFVGYRWLRGATADNLSDRDLSALAQDLGRALSQLHEIDSSRIPATPAGWENEQWSTGIAELAAVAQIVHPLLSHELRAQAEPYLSGSVPPPAEEGPRRFVHNDMCADHILVRPNTGRLAGLIDFADSMVGDPVGDFVGLIGIGDRSFIAHIVRHYSHALDDDFDAKFDWRTRVFTLRWLADAAVDNPSHLPKHIRWVERAFQYAKITDLGATLGTCPDGRHADPSSHAIGDACSIGGCRPPPGSIA